MVTATHPSTIPSTQSTPLSSVNNNTTIPKRRRRKSVFRCSQCGSMFRLPLWSRESGKGPVCDACSNGGCPSQDDDIHQQERLAGTSPSSDKPAPRMRGRKRRSQHAEDAICANCHTTNTPLWRRDADGNAICNACGLYYKLHMVHRPITMMTTEIKRRKRSSDKKRTNKKDGRDTSEAGTIAADNVEDQHHMVEEQQVESPNQRQHTPTATQKLTSSSSSSHLSSSHPPFPGSPVSSRGSISTSSAGPSSPALESSFLLPPLSPMGSPRTNNTIHHSHMSNNVTSTHSNSEYSTQYLLEKRHGLQQQVARLSSMLSDTIAMIEDIDTSLATTQASPSPPACHRPLPRPEDAAKSLLSLARLPPPSNVLSSPPMRPHHTTTTNNASLPRLPPITSVGSSPPPPFEFS
ncbi:hypothetical protein K492DRAFT_171094, partial [Lichtheimia hyalospora FSU 10163]